MLVGTLGLRYGLTGNAEIYGSGSYLWREDRQFDGESSKNRDKHLSDVSLGISHTFLKDDKNPALIGFLEGTLYEKSRGKALSGKSWLIGATTYRRVTDNTGKTLPGQEIGRHRSWESKSTDRSWKNRF